MRSINVLSVLSTLVLFSLLYKWGVALIGEMFEEFGYPRNPGIGNSGMNRYCSPVYVGIYELLLLVVVVAAKALLDSEVF